MKKLIYVLAIFALVSTNCKNKDTRTNSKPLTEAEFEARKAKLLIDKKVDSWPTPGQTNGTVVALTVSECTWLGGTVEYWASCGGTLMKCRGANGREMCIDEIK
ncbi:MAG TPA: hypothetical protein VK492_08265 [Chitinophagaceae bacterium]|nr:hypothetical protein [Chitinophagaceae bacterium]